MAKRGKKPKTCLKTTANEWKELKLVGGGERARNLRSGTSEEKGDFSASSLLSCLSSFNVLPLSSLSRRRN